MCAPHTSRGHEGKHKGITGAKEGRRYLKKNVEAEFAAKPWNKIVALQMMDKKMRSLEKIVAMNLEQSAKEGAKDKHNVGSKSDQNTVE